MWSRSSRRESLLTYSRPREHYKGAEQVNPYQHLLWLLWPLLALDAAARRSASPTGVNVCDAALWWRNSGVSSTLTLTAAAAVAGADCSSNPCPPSSDGESPQSSDGASHTSQATAPRGFSAKRYSFIVAFHVDPWTTYWYA